MKRQYNLTATTSEVRVCAASISIQMQSVLTIHHR
jgi:hypothetical protein